MRVRLASLAVLLVSAAVAHADSVTFTIGNPTQTGTAGSTLTFSGTAAAPSTNTSVEYLNALSENFNPIFTGNIDDSAFYNDFALSLPPGASYTGDLFSITLPAGANTYQGLVTLYGGSDPDADNVLSTANINVTVSNGTAVTPEPSSLVLLGTGVLGAAFLLRRRAAPMLNS